MLLALLRTICTDDAAVSDLLAAWYLQFRDEVNCVCAWKVADALCKADEFVGKVFHPGVAIRIQFDEVSEFKGVARLVVQHCARELLGVVCFHIVCNWKS